MQMQSAPKCHIYIYRNVGRIQFSNIRDSHIMICMISLYKILKFTSKTFEVGQSELCNSNVGKLSSFVICYNKTDLVVW